MWSGWVGIAQLTGFGVVPLLPGIWSSVHLDTAVTLPVGVECYAAYALRAWLVGGHAISDRTRRFARWSAIFSFALGMGTALAHMLREDAAAADQPDGRSDGSASARSPGWSAEDQPADQPDQPDRDQPDRDQREEARITVRTSPSLRTSGSALSPGSVAPPKAAGHVVSRSRDQDGVQASMIALKLAAAGKPVSRRALRNGGVRRSNDSANEQAAVP